MIPLSYLQAGAGDGELLWQGPLHVPLNKLLLLSDPSFSQNKQVLQQFLKVAQSFFNLSRYLRDIFEQITYLKALSPNE